MNYVQLDLHKCSGVGVIFHMLDFYFGCCLWAMLCFLNLGTLCEYSCKNNKEMQWSLN
jgi:hypothetical protein